MIIKRNTLFQKIKVEKAILTFPIPSFHEFFVNCHITNISKEPFPLVI